MQQYDCFLKIEENIWKVGRAKMATENPMRIITGDGMRTGLGTLGDGICPPGGASASSHEGVAQELGLLLRRHSRHESVLSRHETVPYRSGSAPPSVEGSLAAMGGLFADHPSSANLGGRISNSSSGDAIDIVESEQELRSDPAYLAYYYSHINLNPRLPPPLISRENYRFAHRLGGVGDKRKPWSFDDSSSKSLFSSQPVLPTHKEEPEPSEEEKSPQGNVMRRVPNEWREFGADGLMGLLSTGLGPRPKSLVDLIQEDFPRTPSPVYNQSRSSSRAANDDGVDPAALLDVQLNHLRDSSKSAMSVAEISVAALKSRSTTPKPGLTQILGGSSGGSSASVLSTTPDTSDSISAGPAGVIEDVICGLNGISETRNISLTSNGNTTGTSELAAAFQGLSCADVQGTPAVDEHEQLRFPHSQQHLQQDSRDFHHSSHMQHQQHQQQRNHIAQTSLQVPQSQVFSQAIQRQQQLPGLEQSYRAQAKYGASNLTSQSQLQPGATPNMYAAAAAAAAAMSYMAAGNPLYQNLQSAPLYSPQYGLGGYPINPAIMPAMMAGYAAHGGMPVSYDSAAAAAAAAAAVAAGMGLRGTASGSPGGMGVDMQHLYKYAGQAGSALQSHLTDPFYLHYLQQCSAEDAPVAGSLNDPLLLRGYVSGAHVDLLELQRSQLGSMLGYAGDQKSQFARSGPLGVPITNKSGSVSPAYFGSPPGVGFVMPYPNSPISSPVLPASPVVPGAFSLRQSEHNYRVSSGAGRTGAGGVYAGWQSQRGTDATEEFKGSSLLEELKNSKTRRFELSDITGHVVEFSADQHGSRFIQQKLETSTSEEKALVFKEVLPQALALTTDVFGNYVIQKFFEHGTPQQQAELANQFVDHVLHLSLQMYGCRVIQKALEVVDTEQQSRLVSELDGHIIRCVRDQNGNHVIQKCIECVPPDRIHFIISAFYGQIVMLSTHPYGCRVIQRVLEHCTDEQKQCGIMEEILSATCSLAQDQYGNYVVQHVLEHGSPHERSEIIKRLAGQFVQMSQHKFASNVVEKCLEFGGLAERQILINEMLGHTDDNEPLQAMMKDQFANYVVQKVLETCDDQQRELLLSRIRVHLHALKKYTYGKHIVARVEKLVAAGERRGAQVSS
eukprot:c28290_g2_i2 orf=922-4299(-)